MAAKADGTAAAVAPEYDDSIYIPMHEKNKGKGKGKGGSGSGGSAVASGESGADAPAEAAGAAPQPSRQRIDVYEFVRHGNLIVGIHKIVVRCQERLEGNCLCTMQVARTHGMAICPATCRFTLQTAGKATLRENLYRLAARSPSILEVGFNAGHSAALYLWAWHCNKTQGKKRFLAFDICEHAYTQPCFELLKDHYCADGDSETEMELVAGDSKETLAGYGGSGSTANPKFSMLHIDGGHSRDICKLDIVNARRYATATTVLVVDDASFVRIKELLEEMVDPSDPYLDEIDYASAGLIKTKMHRMFHYHSVE